MSGHPKHLSLGRKVAHLWLVFLFVACLSGCAITGETIHGNIEVPSLTDEQLVEELQSIYAALGQKFNRAEFLIAIKPDPAYVLTSSYTSFGGTYSARTTTYTMPYQSSGSGTVRGSAMTTYSYQDQNAFAEALVLFMQLVNQSKIHRLQERGNAIIAEYRTRADQKRKNIDVAIQEFLSSHSDLAKRRTLLAAILPWVKIAKGNLSDAAMLEEAGGIARELRTPKFKTLWFGTFSQLDRLPDGTLAWSNFVHANIRVVGDVVTGEAVLGTREEISLQGAVTHDPHGPFEETGTARNFRGVVTSKTMGGSFECTGTITETELTASYKGRAYGRLIEGAAVLLR